MRIFLAAPITGWFDSSGSHPRDALKVFLNGLKQGLCRAGHDVFSAHYIEEFGAKPRNESVFTPFDFLEVRRADLIVAFPLQSGGVHVEIGWASSLKKHVILLASGKESPLARSLDTLTESATITVSPSFPSDPQECARVTAEIIRLADRPSFAEPRRHVAFITTAFGFGPAAKAIAIAKEFRQRRPRDFFDFFGSGIDHDFAVRSDVFDHVIRFNVDDASKTSGLVEHLALYDDVISVMNFLIAQDWRGKRTRLHIVDSLAWMWPERPAGAENATHYFIQRYLVDDARLDEWGQHLPISPVDYICREPPTDVATIVPNPRHLLVNFSGCANPLIGDSIYRDYAILLARWIAEESVGKYDRIAICVQRRLADLVAREVTFPCEAEVAHLSPDDFTRCLAGAGRLLTSPGITTTLEAIAMGRRPYFLLAQNYSQALLNERNRRLYPGQLSMAFSHMGPGFEVPEGLPEAAGVDLVATLLKRALHEKADWLRARLREMLSAKAELSPSHTGKSGQRQIVDAILASSPKA